MYDLLTIGDCMIDSFHLLDDGEIDVLCSMDSQQCQLCMTYADKIPVRELVRMVAGNPANNVIGATRLGMRSAIYTVIGDDDGSHMIREQLHNEGVALDYIIAEPGKSSNYSTVLSFKGERTILVYHVPRTYRLPAMQATKWVYLTSMGKGGETIFADLARYLRETKAKLVYQPGTFQLRLGSTPARELLQLAELVIMNKQEAQEYLKLPDGEPKELLTGLLLLGPKTTVVTDGTQGSYAAIDGKAWFLGVRPDVPRKESTGAGDAYATGFAVARMLDYPVPEAMRWGTFNAEAVIQQIGPQAGLLTRAAIEHDSQKFPQFVAQPI